VAEHQTLGNPSPDAEAFDLWEIRLMFGTSYQDAVTYSFNLREIE
jgi:hypothetical protein